MSNETKASPEAEHNNELNLDNVKNTVDWESLASLHKETLTDIQSQLALVEELRKKYADNMSEEIAVAFTGLTMSFTDLIKETISIGLDHAVSTNEVAVSEDETMEFSTEFRSGLVADDDDESLLYLNIGSRYMNIQDKTVSLISMGWVDLFAKLKLPTGDLEKTIQSGMKNADKSMQEDGSMDELEKAASKLPTEQTKNEGDVDESGK